MQANYLRDDPSLKLRNLIYLKRLGCKRLHHQPNSDCPVVDLPLTYQRANQRTSGSLSRAPTYERASPTIPLINCGGATPDHLIAEYAGIPQTANCPDPATTPTSAAIADPFSDGWVLKLCQSVTHGLAEPLHLRQDARLC